MKTKSLVEESTTYYFVNGDDPIHADDWSDYGEVDDFWSYTFISDENGLLTYYLGKASKEEVDTLCHVLVLGTGVKDFHHALFSVLKEFR